MGMFDNIRCDRPLPDGWQSDDLQTKDFDCEMVTHIISSEGRLLLDKGYHEEVPESERPYPNAKRGSLESICGSMRRVPKYEDANFHGVVNFYGAEVVGHESSDWYPGGMRPVFQRHEYYAKFTDGQLVEITFAPPAQGDGTG